MELKIDATEAGEFFWSMEDLCRRFGVVPQTIRRWVKEGKLPQPDFPGSIHEAGSKKLWLPSSVVEHIRQVAKAKAKGLKQGA